tara:strand:- start:2780 stop:4393 length:1614 start_codon:yes stop_codon:yes gene_type:complete
MKKIYAKSKTYSLSYFVLFISILLIQNCSENNQVDSNLVFRYNEHKNINSLDPAFAKDVANIWVVNQLFNGLVEMDQELRVIPSIAESWKISNDGKKYTFFLKNNIKFHEHPKLTNRNVTAEDFVYSFDRLLDPALASPGGWVFNKVENYTAINDSILEISLKEPFNAFLGILTMKYCSVVPKEVVEYYGDEFRSNPVGTGPFKFKRWEENIKLVFRKNHEYFQKDSIGNSLPYLESIAITFLQDKQSEFLQFIQDNLDFVSGLDDSYKDEIITNNGELKKEYTNSINLIRGPYLNTEYLAFYLESNKNEIKSEILRKAVNHGFDRNKMIKYLRNGVGIPANGGFIPMGLPGYSDKIGYKYNPDYAKELISQYNRDYNQEANLKLTTTSNYLVFCEYIQKELEKIGLQITIDVIPGASLKEAKANGKLDFFRASWVADYPDAENYLSLFYSKNFAPKGPNYTHFSNSEFDKLYESVLGETSQSNREVLYRKMDSLIMKKSIIIPLFYDEVIRFTRKNLNGMQINATNLLDLRYVKKL